MNIFFCTVGKFHWILFPVMPQIYTNVIAVKTCDTISESVTTEQARIYKLAIMGPIFFKELEPVIDKLSKSKAVQLGD